GRVRELGCLVPRLLEEAATACLGFAERGRGVALAGLAHLGSVGFRAAEHVGRLTLDLPALAVELDVCSLELALAPAHLFFGTGKLGGGCRLRVALEHVGELGCRTDEMERVHAD